MFMVEISYTDGKEEFMLIKADGVREALLIAADGIDPAADVRNMFARKLDVVGERIIWNRVVTP
jgi:hypothetical protein